MYSPTDSAIISPAKDSGSPLTARQLAAFDRDGYLVVRELADAGQVQAMRASALEQLAAQRPPLEYEADVAYPGAPVNRQAQGGNTVRRLLQAFDRDPVFHQWAQQPRVVSILTLLLRTTAVHLTRNHHNCVMTKHPGYSSATLWHQDLRYWSFAKPTLINSWLALGDETPNNGCMWLLPGSHRLPVAAEQLDEAKFLRSDLAENQALIHSAVPAELHAGDVLFFHAGVFHAAGRNETETLKLSTVLTYYGAGNHPLPGSKSSRYADVDIQ